MQRRTKIGVAIAGVGLVSCCVGGAALWAFHAYAPNEEADRRVRIVAWAHGQSVSDVDARICAPIVEALLRVEGVAEPWSEAREGACVVAARIESPPSDDAASRIRAAVEGVDVPEPPIITVLERARTDLYVVVEGAELATTSASAERYEHAFEAIPGVLDAAACGTEGAIEVRVDPARLAALGASIGDVERAITSWQEPSGMVVAGYEQPVRARGMLDEVSFAGVEIGGGRLEDVAAVALADRPGDCSIVRAGESAAAVRIEVLTATSADVAARVRDAIRDHEMGTPHRVTVVDGALDTWTVETLSSDRRSLERIARSLSEALGAESLVRVDAGRSELTIAARPEDRARVRDTIARQPGIALSSAPHPLARVWVEGADWEARARVAGDAARAIEATGAVAFPAGGAAEPTVDVRIDPERLAGAGLREADVVRAAQAASGIEIGRMVHGGRDRAIVLVLGSEPADDPSIIATVMVGRTPIGQVATVELTTRPAALFRHGAAPASPILVSFEGEDEPSFDAISTAVESIELPAGVTVAVERW